MSFLYFVFAGLGCFIGASTGFFAVLLAWKLLTRPQPDEEAEFHKELLDELNLSNQLRAQQNELLAAKVYGKEAA